jgi:hypothetical protein
MKLTSHLPKLALAALFAAGSAGAVVATEAAHPAATAGGPLAATSAPAAAQGYGYYHRGWYRWHGRYWAHRRWHPRFWDGRVWRPGFYIYF